VISTTIIKLTTIKLMMVVLITVPLVWLLLNRVQYLLHSSLKLRWLCSWTAAPAAIPSPPSDIAQAEAPRDVHIITPDVRQLLQ
jgi:hypothetical protein